MEGMGKGGMRMAYKDMIIQNNMMYKVYDVDECKYVYLYMAKIHECSISIIMYTN